MTRVLPTYYREENSLLWRPRNPVAVEEMLAVPSGQSVVLECRQPRNLKHHNMLFGMLGKMVKAGGQWHSTEELLDDIMRALKRGEYRTCRLTLEQVWVRERINFEAMDQQAFAALYAEIKALLLDVLGFDPEELLTPERKSA